MAASGCDDKTARLWDIQTGTCLHVLIGHDGGIGSVAFSPKGEQIVTSSDDLTARLWSVETGECLRVLIGHTDMIKPAIFSPKGDRIATASYDGTVRLWDSQTGECIHSLEDHSDYVSNIAFSPKGDLLASSGGDKTVRLWNPTSGQCRAVIRAFQPVLIMTWTSDTKYLVGGCMDGSVGTWEVAYDEDHCSVDVRWRATAGALVVEDASVQNARGMGPSKRRLLKQRGAIGEPVHPLREAGKKFIRMASVVSKLKSASSKSASADVKQPEQKRIKEQPRARRHTR
jgi:WD40 repeat protein